MSTSYPCKVGFKPTNYSINYAVQISILCVPLISISKKMCSWLLSEKSLPFLHGFLAGFTPYSEATFIAFLRALFHGFVILHLNCKDGIQEMSKFPKSKTYFSWRISGCCCAVLWWCWMCLFPSVEQLHQLNVKKEFQTTQR